MIKYAADYPEKTKAFLREMSFDLKNKYFFTDEYASWDVDSKNSNWENLELVYIDKNQVVGYFKFVTNRPYRRVSLSVISIGSFEFIKAFRMTISKMFQVINPTKLSWGVLVGNPAEKIYDRFCSQNGGRIVGVYQKHETNMIGEICDLKLYEILAEDYWKHNQK